MYGGKKFSDETVKDVLFSSLVHVNIYQLEKMIYFKYTLPLKWYIFLRCNFVKAHTFLRILEEILAEEIR